MEYFSENVLVPNALSIYMNLNILFDYEKIVHIIQNNDLNFSYSEDD